VRRTYNARNNARLLDANNALGLRKAGLIVKQKAQTAALVLTGRMMRGITVDEPFWRGKQQVVQIGPTVDYAVYTEEEPYIEGKHPGPISQAKGATIPWFKPAFEESKGEATQVFLAQLRIGLAALAAHTGRP
jgi:hypothetical protein